jgi:hypothetical protein
MPGDVKWFKIYAVIAIFICRLTLDTGKIGECKCKCNMNATSPMILSTNPIQSNNSKPARSIQDLCCAPVLFIPCTMHARNDKMKK